MGDTLYVIPARGGSKGLPKKNLLPLNGKPLIQYTIDATKVVAPMMDICFSSDDEELISIAESSGIEVPFVRPADLSSDTASTRSVLLHAFKFYTDFRNKHYNRIVLLQPTSPLRLSSDIENALDLFRPDIDMVVSVYETKSNPYYVLFEENQSQFLEKSKNGFFLRRQDCPIVYEFNGAVYVIGVDSLLNFEIAQMPRIVKYLMPEERSVDIDSKMDFMIAAFFLTKENA